MATEPVVTLIRYLDPPSGRQAWCAVCDCGWAGPNRRGILRGWWRAVVDGAGHRRHLSKGDVGLGA